MPKQVLKQESKQQKASDPLYQIFEHLLATKSYENSKEFTKQLAEQYLSYLDTTLAHVPFDFRETLIEDLQSEAYEMLVRKMYGCMRDQDHTDIGQVLLIE